MNRALLIALLVAPLRIASAQATPTAAEIVARIKEHAGVQVRSTTVDTFKAGDPQTRVKGVALTMMATLDVLKRAVARGDNFVITHEPTFYTARDTLAVLESENDSMSFSSRNTFASTVSLSGGFTTRRTRCSLT